MENKIGFVKEFGYTILKARFLFDKYVIKREFIQENEKWSLKSLKSSSKDNVSYANVFEDTVRNNNIIMLLAMFHVSHPTLSYKHWLNATLKYLLEQDTIEDSKFIKFLEDLAKAYLFNRNLKQEDPITYYEIIYKNNSRPIQVETNYNNLNQGVFVENFIFNHLDYLIWKVIQEKGIDYFTNKSYFDKFSKKDSKEINREINKFEFTLRSSVEHFYPRTPQSNLSKLDVDHLDNFGNLCLVSTRRNSEFQNKSPEAKRIYYRDKNLKIESIKQILMFKMDEISKNGWAEKELKNIVTIWKKSSMNYIQVFLKNLKQKN